MEKIIIIGAGGHSRVILDILIKCNRNILGFLDDNAVGTINGYNILGKVADCCQYADDAIFVIGIGNNKIRKKIANDYKQLNWTTAVHPNAIIATDVQISNGAVVMANAVINTGAKIGNHSIINTGAIVEHDCIIADYVHISPKVALGGTCQIGEGTHLGIGSTVINNINICNDCIIGAGGVVVKNINKSGTYIGIPTQLAQGNK